MSHPSKQQFEAQRLMIVGAISERPAEEQEQIHRMAEQIRELANTGDAGTLAFALVSVEFARDTEE